MSSGRVSDYWEGSEWCLHYRRPYTIHISRFYPLSLEQTNDGRWTYTLKRSRGSVEGSDTTMITLSFSLTPPRLSKRHLPWTIVLWWYGGYHVPKSSWGNRIYSSISCTLTSEWGPSPKPLIPPSQWFYVGGKEVSTDRERITLIEPFDVGQSTRSGWLE